MAEDHGYLKIWFILEAPLRQYPDGQFQAKLFPCNTSYGLFS